MKKNLITRILLVLTILFPINALATKNKKPVGLKFTCVPGNKAGAILDVRDDEWREDDETGGQKVERIGFRAADGARFRSELKECLGKHLAITRIDFTSGGGDVDAAFEIAQAIAEYRFHTHVPAGSRCVSACTLAFLGGMRRTVHSEGTYEVHGFTQFMGGGETQFAHDVLKILKGLPEFSQEKVGEMFGKDVANEVPALNAQLKEIQTRIGQIPNNAKQFLDTYLGWQIQGSLQEVERSSALLSRRWMQMVQQRRVSSKLLDHIFATTTSGVRPLSRQELEDLAVITDDGQ